MDIKEQVEKIGIVGMYEEDVTIKKAEAQKVVNELLRTIHQRPAVAKELMTYRKYVPKLIEYTEFLDKFCNVAGKTFGRMEDDSEEKKYQRWTELEDNMLVEMACTDISMLELSARMGRTVPSIKTRLSKLVGIKRISQEVAGKFIGTINGNHAECTLDGTLYKER